MDFNIEKIISLFGLISVIILNSCSSDFSFNEEKSFVKFYGEPGRNDAVDIIYNSAKEEYFVLGSQDLGDTSGVNFYYFTVDKVGNMIDSDTISFGLGGDDVPKGVKLVDDTHYLVYGTAYNQDDIGTIVWSLIDAGNIHSKVSYHINKTFASANYNVADVLLQENDDLVVFGTTSMNEPNDQTLNGDDQFLLVKTNIISDTVYWSQSYGYSGDDEGIAAFETAEGGIVMFGNSDLDERNFTGKNVSFIFVNENGVNDGVSEVFGFTSNPSFDDYLVDVIKVGNSFRLVGTSYGSDNSSVGFVAGVDQLGVLSSSVFHTGTIINEQDFNVELKSISRNYSGEYVVTGKYLDFTNTEDRLDELLMFQLDAFGVLNQNSEKVYGIASGNDEGNSSISIASGSSLVLGTFEFGSNTTLIGLLKFTSDGEF